MGLISRVSSRTYRYFQQARLSWLKLSKRTSSLTPKTTLLVDFVPPSPRNFSEVTMSPLSDAKESSSPVTTTETSSSCLKRCTTEPPPTQKTVHSTTESIHDDQANGSRYASQQNRPRPSRPQATSMLRRMPTTIRHPEEIQDHRRFERGPISPRPKGRQFGQTLPRSRLAIQGRRWTIGG